MPVEPRPTSTMKVLVSGADGFLGNSLVGELIGRGYTVRALLEPGRDEQNLNGWPVERVRGDVRSASDFESAAEGCDFIVHAAASTDMWPARSATHEQINVDGTRNAILAAQRSKVRRLVYVGTANSLGFGSAEDPGDETRPYGGSRYGLGYMDSKYQAHRLVVEAAARGDLPAVVCAPTFMFGPNDSKPGSGRMIIAVARKKVRVFTSGGRNYIHVRDVATGIANALDRGNNGDVYILGNENLAYPDIFEKIAQVCGVSPPRIAISNPVCIMAGCSGSFWGRVSGKTPALTLAMSRIACDSHYYSSAKAIRDLDLPQTPIEDAIAEAIAWFRAHGYLPDDAREG